MICNKPKIDLGTLKEGETGFSNFTITNNGNTKINITATGASCGCTSPKMELGELEPGESRDAHVSFNTKGRRGENFKNIYIDYIENKAIQRFNLSLKCIVI